MTNVTPRTKTEDTTFNEKDKASKEAPRYRIKKYDSGGTYKIECRDPYGFWYILPMKGPVPETLSGTYTSIFYAETALENYIQERDKNKQAREAEEPEPVERRDVDGERRTQRPDDYGLTRT